MPYNVNEFLFLIYSFYIDVKPKELSNNIENTFMKREEKKNEFYFRLSCSMLCELTKCDSGAMKDIRDNFFLFFFIPKDILHIAVKCKTLRMS